MAVTTTYRFDFVANIATLAGNESGADAVGLFDGGFAYVVTQGGATALEAFFGDATSIGGATAPGTGPSIAELEFSGDLVVATTDGAAGVGFSVINGGDGTVVSTSIGDANTSAPDVASLSNGGFVIAMQDNFDPPDKDIEVRIRNGDGTPVTSFVIDDTLADDRNPSVVGLSSGGFAVAWERHVPGSTQLWAAVYENSGAVFAGPTIIDSTGLVNEDASLAALPDGRLALVFEDNEGGSRDIRLMILPNILGLPLVNVRLTTAAAAETNPAIAVLSNGMLAVTYQEDDNGPGDIDSHVMLVDPSNGAVLADRLFNATFNIDANPTVAAMFLGRVAAFSDTGANVEGEIYQGVRVSNGDNAPDTINGDDLVDDVFGGDGSDTINGFGNNDSLDGGGNSDTLDGGEGDDLLEGGPDADVLLGGAGNDSLYGFRASSPDGSAFADTLNGGAGDDFLRGAAGPDTASYAGGPAVTVSLALVGPQNTIGAGFDTLVSIENLEGSGGDDSLTGDDGANQLTGGAGDDALSGGGENDILNGGANDDTLNGDANDDTLNGGAGNDTLDGGANSDTLNGGDNNDTLSGGLETDTINGGPGDDLIRVLDAEVIDVVDGGADVDTLDMSAETTIASIVNLGAGTHIGNGGTRATTNVENFIGTQVGDLITGSVELNLLEGRGGDDLIQGGLNVDTVNGGAGDDIIVVLEGDFIDVVDGGADTDTYDFSAVTSAGVTVNLQGGMATGMGGTHAAINLENVIGTQLGDTITGNASANALTGGNGDDTLNGGAGDDMLTGGGGGDIAVYSGAWRDYLVTGIVGTTTVADQRASSPNGTDSVSTVETLRFSNGDFAIGLTLRDIPVGTAISAKNAAEGTAFSFNASTHFSDADAPLGDVLTFSATGLPSWLAINATTGVLSGTPGFTAAAAATTVTVTATDVHGLTASSAFQLTVANTNRAPTALNLSATSVAENAAVSAVVGTLSAVDPDTGATFTFSEAADPDGKFSVVGNQLRVAAALNFESKASHSVTLRATDQGGLTFDRVVTIGVTNVNEAPTAISLSPSAIPEFSANAAVVGTLAATDPDAGSTATFSLLNDAEGRFALSGNEIRVANGRKLDFEQAASHQISVRATDAGGLSRDQNITITIGNVDPENVTGTASVDVFLGGALGDTFSGLGADDALNGGGGADTASFSGPRGNYQVHTTTFGGVISTRVRDGVGSEGADTLTGFETLGFSSGGVTVFGAQQNLTANVDGARFDDIVYRAVSNGQVIFKDMTAGAAGAFDAITSPLTTEWTAIGTGDLTGDGKADVVIWNSTTGQVFSASPGASGAPTYAVIANGINGNFAAVGTGDLDGDGFTDLVVRDSSSGAIVWRAMPGGAPGAFAPVGTFGPDWTYQGIGDVNRDGFADVAIRSAAGQVVLVNMANGTPSGFIDIGNVSGFRVGAIADVNADGFDDIALQNEANGQVVWRDLSGVGAPYKIATDPVGTQYLLRRGSDIDNDGSADLIFQHATTGETIFRAMDAGVGTGWGAISSSLGGEYLVV